MTTEEAFNLAQQHHQAGRLGQAEQIYRAILAEQGGHVHALHFLGVLVNQNGQSDQGIHLIRQAIALKPDYAEAYSNLGIALKDGGQFEEAIAAYHRAIGLMPNYAEAHYNLANALSKTGELDQAIGAYRQAIAIRPQYPNAHNNLGNALMKKGELDDAIAAYRQAVADQPNYTEAFNNLGKALYEKGDFDEAIIAYQKAIALNPKLPEPRTNLGNLLKDKGHIDEAIAAHRGAIEVSPRYPPAYYNLGAALKEKRQIDDAIAAFRRAIAINPTHAKAHCILGHALLQLGDYAEGWEENEWRLQNDDSFGARRKFTQEMWDGSPLGNRTLLLHAEQGLGDTLQFIRYLPMVKRRGGGVIVECQSQLRRLLQRMAGSTLVLPAGSPLPDFDLHFPLMSLPRLLGTTLQNIPHNVPYIEAYPREVEKWANRLKRLTEGQQSLFKVGLAWAGNPQVKGDRTRSLSLDRLAPLAPLTQTSGVTFYGIQKGQAARQMDQPPEGFRLVNLSAELQDFAETAAAISQMDLVITTDTSVAHLAGAMGRPVWVLLQFMPDWRWLLDRTDSPWYPTMRLFRQREPSDWDGVLKQIAGEFATMLEHYQQNRVEMKRNG